MNEGRISISGVNSWYGDKHILKNICMEIAPRSITSFIGPSACGKTTMLKSINRMNDLVPTFRITGSIKVDDIDVYKEITNSIDLMKHRRRVGMVFQSPNPLPMSILKNLELPIKENFDRLSCKEIKEIIDNCLKSAHIYDEVSSRLQKNALMLSGGQQQRLCIARALTISPEIILFDEPCSALDPISTMKIEELLCELKGKYTIVIVTHNLEQAMRISDNVAFFYQGELVEYGSMHEVFMNPQKELTQNYITGRF